MTRLLKFNLLIIWRRLYFTFHLVIGHIVRSHCRQGPRGCDWFWDLGRARLPETATAAARDTHDRVHNPVNDVSIWHPIHKISDPHETHG